MKPNRRTVTVSLAAALGLPLLPRRIAAEEEVMFDVANMLPGDFT